jgi:hypothetical protein
MTPVERRGWACGLANSSSRDEARSPFLAFIRKQGGVVHLIKKYRVNNRERSMMPKIDLKKENKELYNIFAKEVPIVDVPEINFSNYRRRGRPQYITGISGFNRGIVFGVF